MEDGEKVFYHKSGNKAVVARIEKGTITSPVILYDDFDPFAARPMDIENVTDRLWLMSALIHYGVGLELIPHICDTPRRNFYFDNSRT